MKHKPFVRSPYNYDPYVVSMMSATIFDPSEDKTVQSHAQEADINFLVRRYGLTGQIPVTSPPTPIGAFEGIFDFQSAMNTIRAAQEAFNALPVKLRARFQNDPAAFYNFCHDEKNLPEMRELGLAAPPEPAKVPPEPMLVRLAPDSPPLSNKGST